MAGVFVPIGLSFRLSVGFKSLWRKVSMNIPMMLVEVILAGFFAVACIRTCIPENPGGRLRFTDVLRFPGRIERLHRSRWQWFSMVALLLVLRLQAGLPLVLEVIVAGEFAIFLAVPTRVKTTKGLQRRGNEAAVGSR